MSNYPLSPILPRKTPWTHTSQVKLDCLPRPVELLILAMTDLEFDVVLQDLRPPVGQEQILCALDGRTAYYVGRYGQYTTVLSAAFETAISTSTHHLLEALRLFQCQLVINVGIAWGVSPQNQKLGDVLVANRVINIDLVKSTPTRIVEQNKIPQIYSRVEALVSTARPLWEDEHKTRVYMGLYVGSNALLDDDKLEEAIKGRYPDVIGGEVDAVAVYETANFGNVPWIVIKGISQWVKGNKDDQSQLLATRKAIAFAALMFRNCQIDLKVKSFPC